MISSKQTTSNFRRDWNIVLNDMTTDSSITSSESCNERYHWRRLGTLMLCMYDPILLLPYPRLLAVVKVRTRNPATLDLSLQRSFDVVFALLLVSESSKEENPRTIPTKLRQRSTKQAPSLPSSVHQKVELRGQSQCCIEIRSKVHFRIRGPKFACTCVTIVGLLDNAVSLSRQRTTQTRDAVLAQRRGSTWQRSDILYPDKFQL